jgi:hypothetical protein
MVVGRIASDERKIDAVHIQIVNFQLTAIDEAQSREACEEKAPAFASGTGLLSKIWLADHSTHGGVYIGGNRQTKQAFADSDRFRGIAADLQAKNSTSHSLDVLETPIDVTPGTTRVGA